MSSFQVKIPHGSKVVAFTRNNIKVLIFKASEDLQMINTQLQFEGEIPTV